MLQVEKKPHDDVSSVEYRDENLGRSISPTESLSAAAAFVVRQYPIIIFVSAIVLVLGFVYIFSTPSRYTAQASLIIDTRKVQIFQQSILGDPGIDAAAVESQVEILKSENIALGVIKNLRLTEDQEFVGSSGGFIFSIVRFVAGLFDAGAPTSEFELTRSAVGVFQSALTVKRVGLTYVIQIGFTSLYPDKSAQIANAVVDAYLVDTLEAKFQATRRASVWLQDRLRELRDQAAAADRAVVEYKTKNNIVDAGGRLVGDQQLAEYNTQLVMARAQMAESRARLDRIEALKRNGDSEGTVTDALRNDVIVRLRTQLLDLSKREAEWSSKYGRDHLAVVNLRNEMAEIRRSILDELGRIAETYKSDFEISKARLESIQKSMGDAVTQSQTTSQAQVALKDLESTAQSYRTLYDNFLQRYMESVQQQTFPITEARFITQATPPGQRSQPKSLLILAISLFAGVACGIGAALIRDLLDRVIRTTDQAEKLLGIECITALPLLKEHSEEPENSKKRDQSKFGPRTIVRSQEHFWQVVDEPFSRYAEGVRAIKVAIDLAGLTRSNKVIGLTSSLPNEGKSSVSTNLAQLIANSGKRVVLVDCDLRNPSLSRLLTPSASSGLIEVISGKMQVFETLWTEPSTMLDFAPTVLKNRLPHTNEIVASDAMKGIFAKLRQMYDFVIVDLPPLAPVVDVRSTTHLIDSYIFVVEWGATKIDVITHALRRSQVIQERLLGTVLNKVDISALGRFESYRGNYYRNKYYSRYGYVE
jgi:polysaccharide biosynthesis transport protein